MRKIYRNAFSFLVLTPSFLLLACSGHTASNSELPDKIGAGCQADSGCKSPLVCFSGTCHSVCNVDPECEKSQVCKNNVCHDVDNPLCNKDDDCQSAGQCETLLGAYCEGARCHYSPRTVEESCNDDNVCTENDHCDGHGKCVGEQKVCNEPPSPSCNDDDNVYTEYTSTGSCVMEGNKGCVYEPKTRECDDCLVNCLGFCQDVVCPSVGQKCKQNICDPQSLANPPCSLINLEKSTPCIFNDATSDRGYCDNGECFECTEDSHCQNFPNEWYECYVPKCQEHKCVYGVKTDNTLCGNRCIDGLRHNTGRCGVQDEANPVLAECFDTAAQSCGGYACEDAIFCRKKCENNDHCADGFFCQNGSCVEKLASGAVTCSDDYMCQSGHCDLDAAAGPETGRCCQSGDCCDNNDDCVNDDVCRNNMCTSDAVGRSCANDNDCNSKTFCDISQGTCQQKKSIGSACGNSNECNASSCVDGVCCQSQVCGTCESCAISGHFGQCYEVSAGSEDDTCRSADKMVCGDNKKCLKQRGQNCNLSSECYNSACVDGICCGSQQCGECQACNISGNLGTCTSVGNNNNDDTCLAVYNVHCTAAGKCKKNNGQAANSADECASGYLVDGVCCEQASCEKVETVKCQGMCQYDLTENKCQPGTGKCTLVTTRKYVPAAKVCALLWFDGEHKEGVGNPDSSYTNTCCASTFIRRDGCGNLNWAYGCDGAGVCVESGSNYRIQDLDENPCK